MASAITGTIGLVSGLVGLTGGLRAAKAGPGIGPLYSILSGNEQQAAANVEANAIGRMSDFAYEQSLREAAQKDYEVTKVKEQQALDYASRGVTLAGSPMAVLTETQQLGDQESAAIRRRGQEQADLYSVQGLQMLRRGSAAAFGGFANALQSQFSSKQQSQMLKTQAIQSGLKGAGAFVSGIGASGIGKLFGGGGGGGGSTPFDFNAGDTEGAIP